MNVLRKLPTSIIFIMCHIIFSSSTMLASDYEKILSRIGSINTQGYESCIQTLEMYKNPHASKTEFMTQTLKFKITQQDAMIKKLQETVSATKLALVHSQVSVNHLNSQMQLALSESKTNERLLRDQNQQYKKLAILGGITTSLAIGFIVADKYWDKR